MHKSLAGKWAQHPVCGGKICCLGQALGMGIKCKQNTVLCT